MSSSLADHQQRMQALITDLAGAGQEGCAGLVRGTDALPAPARLELYRRTYHGRLLGCLRESYPALRHALGDELFEAFALDYLAAQPSRSYTLNTLGAGWPDHLESTRASCGAATRGHWASFLVDLARLERVFCEVYDAPGGEGRTLPSPEELPVRPDDDWLRLTATPLACLRLLDVRSAVAPYLLAVRRGDDPPLPPPANSHLALCRRDYTVTITELDGVAFALLGAIAGGASIVNAAREAALQPSAAWMLLRDWTERGFFGAINVPAAPPRDVQSTKGVAR